MYRQTKKPSTQLNKHDRKVLNKYAGVYSNFIESSTADADTLMEKAIKRKV